jgi:hypothetical protein
MSTGPINNLNNTYLQSILNSTLQASGLSTGSANNTNGILATVQQGDNQQLSPLAQMMSQLQQLQQSNPSQYQQVTAQIAKNLQSAASTASAEGNTAAATQLNQLSTDFTQASQTGQLPNIQDVAQAVGGHHHHGHHHAQAADADSSSSTTSSTSTSQSQTLSQLLSAFQTSSVQSDSLNPTAIILNTLNQAGIGGANG